VVTKEILDPQEVADMLRVHPRTVMKLASQGQLPGFKVGGQWRFRREAIDQYIREQEQQYSDQKKDQKSILEDGSDTPSADNDQ
jgi:excisionase family DNA binding protein